MALLKFIHKALDEGRIPAAIFLDVRKAFDSISHTILLSKMEHIGIRGISYHWFETYLSERSISIDPKLQDQFRVDFGVPQGSILGPVLFLIFINDLFIAVSKQTKRSCCSICDHNFVPPSDAALDPVLFAFADDSTLGCSEIKDSSLIKKVYSVLERTFAWFDANRLALNLAKSSLLIFSRSGTSCPLVQTISTTHGDITRPPDRHTRFLGILLDENLSNNTVLS